MSNAQPAQPKGQGADIIELPLSRKQERLYTDLIADAQKYGEKPCLVSFRANEKLYGLYGTGYKVAGSLRGLSPRADFKGLGFDELADVYLNPKLQELSHDAVQELVEQKGKAYSGEPVLVFFADEKGPESLYDDEPTQIGQDT